ncbi:MAG: DUF2834 domain-containing protein, partial [Caldilineaceae bacterium]|nr:DUF2834 domain-containing protein [Caldilineaceae bacterium]
GVAGGDAAGGDGEFGGVRRGISRIKKKHVYLFLCIVGTVLPYSQFLLWISENGLDVSLLFEQITSSRIAVFGWLDVFVSAVVLFVFIFADGVERRVAKLWLPVVGTLVVGVSLGLPLFLYLVEVAEEGREGAGGEG